MSNREDTDFVNDIREAIQRITSYLGGLAYDDFLKDNKTQDAVIRNIEIIGEAAKGISEELRAETPHIPWKSMAAMRDRLIHHYFGINLDIVWHVISEELPELAPELAALVDEDPSEDNQEEDGG
jgi:uncharacterized protein with HEPN domain